MHTLLVCLFIAALLPYLSKIIVGIAMFKAGGYDNHNPREQQKRLKGMGQRAVAAHQNSFEALLIFAIAVLAVLICQKITSHTEHLAITFIIARLIYHIAYLLDYATFRSIIWFVGIYCSFSILFSVLT